MFEQLLWMKYLTQMASDILYGKNMSSSSKKSKKNINLFKKLFKNFEI